MDVMVSVLVFVIVCLAVVLSYLYVLNHRLDEKERKEEADKAWKKEQGRQKRAAKKPGQGISGGPASYATSNSDQNDFAAGQVRGSGLYGRGEL